MIAVLVATGQNPAFEGISEYLPVPLLQLGDRPFLQHIVEYLANQKIRRFEFILSHLPEKVERALGDGARWGCTFHYHLLPLGGDALRMAANIVPPGDEVVVLGDCERLPEAAFAGISPGTLVDHAGEWTGWGVFAARDLATADPASMPRLNSERCLSTATGADFLISQRLVLEQSFPGLLVSGRQSDPGIWISRNVALHPTVKVTAPVYIGENCRIARGAQIGPSAVIGSNCIIDSQTIVVDSLVAPGSFVGEGLELDSVIVDRNRLLNIRLGTSLLTSEAFLLGSLTGQRGRSVRSARSRLAALLLLLVLWPLLLLATIWLTLTGKASLATDEVILIPAEDDPAAWRKVRRLCFRRKGSSGPPAGFFCRFLPGLLSVVAGSLSLVGVEPRSQNQVLGLSADWRALYLNTKAGLITESDVMFGSQATEDELYTAEVFYSATESFSHDCRLFGLWFWKSLTGSARGTNEADPVR